ncbi:MAG: autotransporter outer membrane beta-barrel domain-containing protein, partial [Deltaproteobacteria bacterium]|nr:autotransporter outer membrane beta-barrel domain-containing protein [Deltaproteobacteria bacterium]
GRKNAKFHVDTWQYAARIGYEYTIDNWSITPNVGVRYFAFTQDAFTEKVTGSSVPATFVARKSDHLLEIPLQVKVTGSFDVGSVVINPQLRLGYTFAAARPDNVTKVGFVGYNGQMDLHGIQHQRNSFQVGATLNVETQSSVHFFANYDLNAAKGFTEHKASVGLGFEF